MDNMWDVFLPVIGVMLVIVLLVFGTGYVVYQINVNVAYANVVKVSVDKIEVFKGKSAFVEITSGGYTTTVKIRKQIFPIEIIEKQYTSKDVVVEQI